MSMILFFKQKTAYEMRISYLSSDVCSSDLKRVAQSTGLDDPDDEMPGAQLAFAEHQRAVDPAPLDGLFDVGREKNGRASRRERVCQNVEISGDAVSLNKKTERIRCDERLCHRAM